MAEVLSVARSRKRRVNRRLQIAQEAEALLEAWAWAAKRRPRQLTRSPSRGERNLRREDRAQAARLEFEEDLREACRLALARQIGPGVPV